MKGKLAVIFLVCGGRDYSDRYTIYEQLNRLHGKVPVTKIVHGGARGADSIAGMWAKDHSIEVQVFPADWDAHGKAAGAIRNQTMLDSQEFDGVVAFPGGPGTAHMVSIAKKKGLKVWCPTVNSKTQKTA